ncbi:hypothetical protein BaRGS_00009412, partial [Batillaria attramentaria]
MIAESASMQSGPCAAPRDDPLLIFLRADQLPYLKTGWRSAMKKKKGATPPRNVNLPRCVRSPARPKGQNSCGKRKQSRGGKMSRSHAKQNILAIPERVVRLVASFPLQHRVIANGFLP